MKRQYPQQITLFSDQMIHFQNFVDEDLRQGEFNDVGVSIMLQDYEGPNDRKEDLNEKRFAMFITKDEIQAVIDILERFK